MHKATGKLLALMLVWGVSFTAASQQLLDMTPIQLVDDVIFIEVYINDFESRVQFLFDTGAGVTVVDKQTAERFEILTDGVENITTSSKTIYTPFSGGNSIGIGNSLRLDSVSFYLMDLDHMSRHFGIEVAGIIGFDLLKSFVTETNIDAMEMRFYAGPPTEGHTEWQSITIIPLESNNFGVQVDIVPKGKKEKIPMVLKVDTGASNFLTFHNPTVTKHQLIDPGKKYRSRLGFGADATITENFRSRVSSVLLLGKKWKRVPAVLEVDPVNSLSERMADGLIGQELLLDFNTVYDLPNGELYFMERK